MPPASRAENPIRRFCHGPVGPPCYQYQLKCQLEGSGRLRKLAIINDVQMAPLALPEMGVGENAFAYSDQSNGERKVRITHHWVERSISKPLPAPSAIYPPDGGEAGGTDIVFRWTEPADPDANTGVKDYHFELSARPDMKMPLSMSFYKLISRTADATRVRAKDGNTEAVAVKPQYTLTEPGLLTPGTRYYWHVRAMNRSGVWGPWSSTWSFTPRGPDYPLDVTLDYDPARNVGTLRWKANPVGNAPVKYRVYGSDEKGFTAADQKRQNVVGISRQDSPMAAWNPWFPANFIAETTATEMAVIGGDVALPAANKSYYRVVAVDQQGKRSGPSDYATAPRPVIYSKPVTTAKAGTEYRYQVGAIRSLGDLSSRMKGDQQVKGYFDIEKPSFTLAQVAAWLKIDPSTGLLSGIPDAAGKVEVAVTAVIEREVRKLDEKALIWGAEKVISTGKQPVGRTTQRFVIEVQPSSR